MKERLSETQTLLATEKQTISAMSEQLESEKRWHSETLLKLNEVFDTSAGFVSTLGDFFLGYEIRGFCKKYPHIFVLPKFLPLL